MKFLGMRKHVPVVPEGILYVYYMLYNMFRNLCPIRLGKRIMDIPQVLGLCAGFLINIGFYLLGRYHGQKGGK